MRDCGCETSKAMTSPDTKEPIRAERVAAQRPGGRAFPGIRLGRWRGVPVSARWSVLFTLGLFADGLATSALPAARPGEASGAYWLESHGLSVGSGTEGAARPDQLTPIYPGWNVQPPGPLRRECGPAISASGA